MPRHTKLTPERQQKIVQALMVGATHKIACQFSGIEERTFYRWMALGNSGRAPYSQFCQAVKETEGAAAVGWLAKIEKAANDGSWQAAAWKLERRHTEDYGRTITKHEGEIVVGIKEKYQEQQDVVSQLQTLLLQIRTRTLSAMAQQDHGDDNHSPA